MCEILVFSRAGHPRCGETIAVKDDGHVWGKKECPPVFEIVKLPGIPKENFADYLEADMVTRTVQIDGKDEQVEEMVARRKKRLDPSALDTVKAMTAEADVRLYEQPYDCTLDEEKIAISTKETLTQIRSARTK